jgi:ATP-binding cassette subfamily F protein uup
MNILNVEKVSKTYGEKQLFDEVTLGVNKGDKIGVIGVNGTGKSTFLKIIAGLEEADAGQVVKGKGVTVAYLEQKAQFPEKDTILGYVLRGKQHSSEAEAKIILTKLGITEFDKDIHALSGGQKKRVALAKTLVEPAEVLILDEPTNHLDNEMVIWLEDYIRQFKGELLMVTHDRYFLDNVTNRIVELDRTHLYSYDTNYSGFLELKTQREQMEMATEEKRQNILRRELEWIRRGCQARSTKQQARIDRYEDMKEASRQARASFEKQAMEMNSVTSRLGKKTIELENITKAYDGITYIRDFSYIFLRDDRIGIIGRNGCGKSTLMKIITGQIQPDSGTVSIGETVKIGYFMQENEPLDEKMTVLEYVRSIGEYVTTATGKATASQMCERFLFTPKMQWTPIEKLSGGEKRRLYLLSVLMSAPNVLILDEPTNDLDIETLEILEDYLDGFAGIVITVSHDRYFLDRIVDRIFAFEENGILHQYEGGFSDYYEKSGGMQAKQAKIAEKPKGKKEYNKDREKKLRFSYKEQKEYEVIDEEIAALEQKIAKLDSEIEMAATQYSRLTELTQEKSELEEQLEFKMNRWVELNELAELIEQQKQK